MREHPSKATTRGALLAAPLFLMVLCAPPGLSASPLQKIRCGAILDGQFTDKEQVHRYQIDLKSGARLTFRVVPVGQTLKVRAWVLDPVGSEVWETYWRPELDVTTGQLSATGTHELRVSNSHTVGDYTVYVGCELRDGTVIEPGSAGSPSAPPPSGADAVTGSVEALGEAAGAVSGSSDLGSFGEEAAKIQGYTEEATKTFQGAAKAVQAVKGLFRAFRGKGKKKQQEQAAPARPVYTKAEDSGPAPTPVYAQPLGPSRKASAHGGGPSSGNGSAVGSSGAGLRPSDLAGRIFPRLGLGMPLEGEVAPGGEIAGCRFVAEAGEQLELSFERLSGEQDLTLIVVDPFGALAFETRLLGNPRVATVLDLPTRGEYTVGVAAAGSSVGSARFKVGLGAGR